MPVVRSDRRLGWWSMRVPVPSVHRLALGYRPAPRRRPGGCREKGRAAALQSRLSLGGPRLPLGTPRATASNRDPLASDSRPGPQVFPRQRQALLRGHRCRRTRVDCLPVLPIGGQEHSYPVQWILPARKIIASDRIQGNEWPDPLIFDCVRQWASISVRDSANLRLTLPHPSGCAWCLVHLPRRRESGRDWGHNCGRVPRPD